VVDLFDNAIKPIKINENILNEAQKLLQKTIDGFDTLFKPIYA